MCYAEKNDGIPVEKEENFALCNGQTETGK